MSVAIKVECPKCHGDRTMLDTCFAMPGYTDPNSQKDSDEGSRVKHSMPVRLILCPRCHFLELYHDVGLCKPV